jgi:hypothetical protein
MKRVKLMLLSLSVLAVVGAALAFNVKQGQFFCTAPTLSGGSCAQACPNRAQLTETVPGNFICTTITIDDLDPTKSTDCQYLNGVFTQCDPVKANVTVEN